MIESNIYFSRHAKRRMRLYDLSEEDVTAILKHRDPNLSFPEGKYEILSETKFSRYGYPIKVVFSRESDIIIIITVYPLKRGLKQ